jgi:hypothetical protein
VRRHLTASGRAFFVLKFLTQKLRAQPPIVMNRVTGAKKPSKHFFFQIMKSLKTLENTSEEAHFVN